MSIEQARIFAEQKLFHKALPLLADLMRQTPPIRGAHLEYAKLVMGITFKYLALEAARKEHALFDCPEAKDLATSIEEAMRAKQVKHAEHPLISLIIVAKSGEEVLWKRCLESISLQVNTKVEVCLISDTPLPMWGTLPSCVSLHPLASRPFSKREEIPRALHIARGDIVSVIERPETVMGDCGLLFIAAAFYSVPTADVIQCERTYRSDNLVFEPARGHQPRWTQAVILDPATLEPPTLLFSWRGVFFRRQTLLNTLPFESGIDHALALDVAIKILRSKPIHTLAVPVVLDETPAEGRSYQLELKEVAEARSLISRERKRLTERPSTTHPPILDPFRSPKPGQKLPRVSPNLLRGGRAAAPSISLVTSVLNGRDYLERCIDSILSQGYPNLEYIILDGGSTDGTQDIIRRYESHLSYWSSSPDDGHYASVQEGLNRSTGSIMSWLNADDCLTPYSLDLAAAIFTGAPHIDWLTGTLCIYSADNELEIGGTPRLCGETYFNDGFDAPFIQQEGTFWRRSLWERAGGALDVRLELASDMELWTRFFQYAHPYTLSVPLGIFQMRPGQRSEIFRHRYFVEAYRVIQRLKTMGTQPFRHPHPEETRLPITVEPA
jgi:hypothetical protein